MKRLLSCQASEMLAMNGQELKEQLRQVKEERLQLKQHSSQLPYLAMYRMHK